MSDFNIAWLKENLSDENLKIFDIGCADLSDSIRFRRYFPSSKIYSFECAPIWQDNNQILCKNYNIEYFEYAISNKSGHEIFYPTVVRATDDMSRYAGTLRPDLCDNLYYRDVIFQDPIIVKTITINDFCKHMNVIPDFLHVDAEGMDLVILSNLDLEFLPKLMWAEVDILDNQLHTEIKNKGFRSYNYGFDMLFVREDVSVTEYRPISWEDPWVDLPLIEKEFLDAYRGLKDRAWPDITTFGQFLEINNDIKKECFENLYIDPMLRKRYFNE